MFEPVAAYTMTSHLYLVSEWAAKCTTHNVPSSCRNWVKPFLFQSNQAINVPFAWTDLTYLLHLKGVSWGYYVVDGSEPDCLNQQTLSCVAGMQTAASWSFFNPLPAFDTVKADSELGNVQSVANFYAAAYGGALPAVSWVVPSGPVSEHPSYDIRDGQAYVTSLINAVMSGPDWDSSAIFLAWDDWSGFYDHVAPPVVDSERLRAACPEPANLSLREKRIYRPCRVELRRLREVHRGSVPGRPAPGPEDRRASRSAAIRPRRARSRQPHG